MRADVIVKRREDLGEFVYGVMAEPSLRDSRETIHFLKASDGDARVVTRAAEAGAQNG